MMETRTPNSTRLRTTRRVSPGPLGLLCFLVALGVSGATGAAGFPIIENNKKLPALMIQRGFNPPQRFKALVIEFTFNKSRTTIIKEERYGYHKTAEHSGGWNAASSVKVFPAIAAIQYVRKLGFNPNARLTFHGEQEVSHRLIDLIKNALTPSDNIAYNRLIQFVGFDRLHGEFLTERHGIRQTALTRAYGGPAWKKLGEKRSLRVSPQITIQLAGLKKKLPGRAGKVTPACGGTCTSLHDLAMNLRNLMLQEQLLPRNTYRLRRSDLIMIRRALRADRKRGEEAVDALRAVFHDGRMKYYHKAGYFNGWYSDNIYIYRPGQKAWIVSMANNQGRHGLDDAARIVGELIEDGAF